MTIEETAEVLAYISLFDGREVTEGVILAWHSVMPANITKADAMQRANHFILRTDKRIQPSHLMPHPDDWMNQ